MKHKKKRKGVVNYAPRCPYCGSTTVYRSATGIYKDNPNDVMLYVCTNYPNCDAYVQTQKGTAIPLGEMANGELRALRNQAHRYFNKLYLQNYMSKQDAYRWLSGILGVPLERAHIGLLGKLGCDLVIEESKKQLSWYQDRAMERNQQKRFRPEVLRTVKLVSVMPECCKKAGFLTEARYRERDPNCDENFCPHCGRWTKISLVDNQTPKGEKL